MVIASRIVELSFFENRTLLFILDAGNRAIGACVGSLKGCDYPNVHRRAFKALIAGGKKAQFTKGQRSHRRGRYPAVNVGISMGMGPDAPVNLEQGKNAEVVKDLLANPDIQRMANHASGKRAFTARRWLLTTALSRL